MRSFYIPIIVIVNFLFQTTLLRYIAIGGVIPNTTLIILVSIALLKGKKIGGILGICMGLLQDIVLSEVIGINALIYFFIGYLVGFVDNKVFKDNLWIAVVFTSMATIFYHITYFILIYFMSIDISFIVMLKNFIWIEFFYNIIFSILIFKGINKLFKGPNLSFRHR